MWIKMTTVAAAAALLGGCALVGGGLAPIPDAREFDSFGARLGAATRLSEFRAALGQTINEYQVRASEKRKMEWDSSGLTTYGGLLAVMGALADRTGLMNTGAGLAGVGLTTTSRYNFHQQAQVYYLALRKLTCVSSKVALIPDEVFSRAARSDDAGAAEVGRSALPMLIASVDGIRQEAVNGTLGIAPGNLSRDDLVNLFNTYRAPPAGAKALEPGVDPAEAARNRAAGETVKALMADVALCVKAAA